MLWVFKIAGAMLLARLAWAILPVVFGALFTAALALLSPITTLRYLFAKKKAPPPEPPPAPFNAHAIVTKYMAEYSKRGGDKR
jgi:hypothetical protein